MLPSEFKRFTDKSLLLEIDTAMAVRVGLTESVIITQLHRLLEISQASDRETVGYDLFYSNVYCCKTIPEWQTLFPFWSESTIKRAFSELKRLELITTISNPKDKWDKTNWYTINYETYLQVAQFNPTINN